MKKVIAIDKENLFITCEAGCTWRELVEYCKSYQLIPLVMPMYVDLSIGGTVSAGGVGSTSFKYGISASIVEEMDVVLANGSLVTCNRNKNKDVFDAVLANTGQVGVICTLKLKLRKYKPETITYYLIYDDIKQWLKDQQSLVNSHCDHIQGFFSYNIQGLRKGRPFVIWFYGLQVAFELSDSNERNDADKVVQKLSPYRRLGEEVEKTEQFAYRFDPRFQAMRQSGAFIQPHPWMEFILPVGKLETIIPTILDKLPFAMGDGHRLVFINPANLPGNFEVPEGSGLAVFAALPAAIPTPQLKDVLPKLKELNEYVVAAGGKRYLSGWLGMMENAEWRQHWGNKYSSWVNQKNKFDPENLFWSKLMEETFTR